MRFKGLDLNLLVALEALLATKSVGAAAARVHLSQPAMSAALRRLRDHFGDPLLVPEGKRFHLSATAEALAPLLAQWLTAAERIAQTSGSFDPTTSQRKFRVIATDYTNIMLATPLCRRLPALAPSITLDFITPNETSAEAVRSGAVDMLLCPENFAIADQPSELLFEERHVVVGWDRNPALCEPLTIEAFLSAGHVIATFGPERVLSYADQKLAAAGIVRRVEVSTSSFATLPWFLPGTMRLAVMHERHARFMCKQAPLRMVELPVPIAPTRVLLQYPRSRADDPAVTWLRSCVHDVAAASEAERGEQDIFIP